jgi:hypothetical protein
MSKKWAKKHTRRRKRDPKTESHVDLIGIGVSMAFCKAYVLAWIK